MPFPRIQYVDGGLYLAELGLWLDAHEPCVGPERVFVSHAHSDHVAAHREVILSEPTSRLMQARVPGQRLEHVLNFREEREFSGGRTPWKLTLLPAGHIFGSAMALLHVDAESLLYTGDFKLRRGLSAEPCEPCRADILVMETTFGLPHYRFPPTAAVLAGVIRFCREALDNDETPVLLGYSLGKSQEVLCALGDAGLPLVLHGSIFRLTRIYELFGHCFPKYEPYEAGKARGKVLLCPPNAANSAMLRNLGRTRSAVLTGWAVDPGCRFRYRCDAAFPISDHADFPDLVELVRQVQPRKVYTLHGFAAEFARTLRELGYDAQALSENEQLSLPLVSPVQRKVRSGRPTPPAVAVPPQPPGGHRFGEFARVCVAVCETPRKLEKVRLLADYLRSLDAPALILAATWFSGRPFPSSHNKTLQLGWAVLRDALCGITGADEQTFHQVYLKYSDLGEAAQEMLQPVTPGPGLDIEEVGRAFEELLAARGPSQKTPVLERVLLRSTPLEAKYLVKTITGDLRIGLKEGLVEEAIAAAFERPADDVRTANLLMGDIGETARLAAEDRLRQAGIVPFRPVKCMLASPEPTAADVLQRVRERHDPAGGPVQVWIEDKYDGIRCQLHKAGNRVGLFSRDLKDISGTFPELTDAASGLENDVVLDGEIVAMRADEVLPFSELQKRLGRKERDLFLRQDVPVVYQAFDLLWVDGVSRIDTPLRERRRFLERLLLPAGFRLALISPAESAEEIDHAFDAARVRGNEGLMIKDPSSTYVPGRRGLAWLKLKKALATLDCVVVGAEYGHGKRSQVLSDYTFAVRDTETGALKTIGKAYTGLTDEEIRELTARFLRTARRQHGRFFEVPPEVVLEIAFDRLQPSQRHPSGLAMRFPRIIRIRRDKTVAEIDTLATAWKLAGANTCSPTKDRAHGGSGSPLSTS